ncbi:hypothetical protein ACN20G_24170 [Streptomyces sp. BI20]|uniref:hypothetical protein n=1 Tax=Streptomyces sp. BI20 TaxID=3403460 RepID=UPI003C72396E
MTEQREAFEDAVMTRIGQAIILLHAGDREEARNRLGALWDALDAIEAEVEEESAAEAGGGPDPGGERAARVAARALHRCTLAHYLADAQDRSADKLVWDLRALDAADALAEEPGHDGPGGAVRAFYPALHLHLADDYITLRRPEAARVHLARAVAGAAALADDGYGRGVRAALARIERRLAGAEPDAHPRPGPFPGPFRG